MRMVGLPLISRPAPDILNIRRQSEVLQRLEISEMKVELNIRIKRFSYTSMFSAR